jgi:hypothetical protein
MPQRKQGAHYTPPRPSPPPRRRPAVNFTIDAKLLKEVDVTAEKFGLFTAQGGETRPRVSALFNGMALMLSRGQIDTSMLYAASCECASLVPEPHVIDQLSKEVSPCV